jgi:DNA-binding LacI/PurR family transcriptional regulator
MRPSENSELESEQRSKHPVAPTVVDVARAADVALGTVSRVLNTPHAVRPDIRQRVLDAIAATGYRRLRQRRAPTIADAGRRRRRGNFGIVLIGMDESLAHLPVITEALHGVELATAAEGINLMLANVPQADRVPAFLAKNQVDGVIVKSPLLGDLKSCAHPDLVAAIMRVPHVWLTGRPDSAVGDVCATDTEAGARLAAEYLHRKGHRRIGYLHPRPGQTRSEGLKLSFSMHAQRLGMTVQMFERPLPGPVRWPLPAINQPADVMPLLDRWLAMPLANRPTAMLVPADSIAVQLYAALRQRGLQAGNELSVLSFNHERPLVGGLSPTLTTIDIRAEAIGRRAVERLLWRIEHPEDVIATKIVVEPVLVEGGSVATIPSES